MEPKATTKIRCRYIFSVTHPCYDEQGRTKMDNPPWQTKFLPTHIHFSLEKFTCIKWYEWLQFPSNINDNFWPFFFILSETGIQLL